MATFALGMTVGARVDKGVAFQYCSEAIDSLRDAGFMEELHLFVEPGADIHVPNDHEKHRLIVTQHKKNRGCFKNFHFGLDTLVTETTADWLFMIQDDCLWKPNSYALMQDVCNDPANQDVGFLSPYTSKSMIPFGKSKKTRKPMKGLAPKGWVQHKFHNKAFWGAVCMVFPRQAAIDMLALPRFKNHRHHRKLDVVIGNCTREMEKRGLIHVPSICDHIGDWSTLGRHRIKGNKWGRRGWGFKK